MACEAFRQIYQAILFDIESGSITEEQAREEFEGRTGGESWDDWYGGDR